jgi:hypothetical protein
MGLLDVLNGMQNGPRGQRTPGTASGGMSPMTMALLGLIAYKAIKSFTGNQPNVALAKPSALPGTTTGAQSTGSAGGGLGEATAKQIEGPCKDISKDPLYESFLAFGRVSDESSPASKETPKS